MIASLIINSFLFIVALIAVSRGYIYATQEGNDSKLRPYIMLCWAFALWCILSIVSAEIGEASIFLRNIFYYLEEFSRIITFVSAIMVLAVLTEYEVDKKKSTEIIIIFFLYGGVFVELINLIVSRGQLLQNVHGVYFNSEIKPLVILHILYDFIVLFVMFLMVVRYYEKCSKPREKFLYRLCLSSVIVLFGGFAIENVMYLLGIGFCSSVILCFAVHIVIDRFALNYKRSIEYNREDYSDVLVPTYEKSVIITNDEGVIIYANKRAQVFAESYRDIFEGRDVCGVFSISDEQRNSIYDSQQNLISVRCDYRKVNMPVILSCENKFDRYKNVFATIFSITRESNEIHDDVKKDSSMGAFLSPGEKLSISHSDITDIRNDVLIESIEQCLLLYEKKERELFFMTLKAVEKGAAILGYSALENLTKRIKGEEAASGIDSIAGLIIEMDRQCESIKVLR